VIRRRSVPDQSKAAPGGDLRRLRPVAWRCDMDQRPSWPPALRG